MTQFLQWAVIVFQNMFSILLSMTNPPHHEVTTFKVVIGKCNLWIGVCLGKKSVCFCVSLSLGFSFLNLFVRSRERIKSL